MLVLFLRLGVAVASVRTRHGVRWHGEQPRPAGQAQAALPGIGFTAREHSAAWCCAGYCTCVTWHRIGRPGLTARGLGSPFFWYRYRRRAASVPDRRTHPADALVLELATCVVHNSVALPVCSPECIHLQPWPPWPLARYLAHWNFCCPAETSCVGVRQPTGELTGPQRPLPCQDDRARGLPLRPPWLQCINVLFRWRPRIECRSFSGHAALPCTVAHASAGGFVGRL